MLIVELNLVLVCVDLEVYVLYSNYLKNNFQELSLF